MPETQPIGSAPTPSFTQSYPSIQSVTINSALLTKLNQRLQSRGSELRLNFSNLTWANISIALYGTAAFASQLQSMNGGGSGPAVHSPDGFDDFMCWVDDDYCWSTYAEASIRIPSNQSLDQFLSSQPAQPAQPTQPAQPPVIAPPVQPPVQPPVTPPDATPDVVTPPPPPANPRITRLNVNGDMATFTIANIDLNEVAADIEVIAESGSDIFFGDPDFQIVDATHFKIGIDSSSSYEGQYRITVKITKQNGDVLVLTTNYRVSLGAEK